MKKIILSIGFLLAMASFSEVEAANISVNVNIGVQPAWGPVGYSYAAFYYFPDINVYYNVNQGLFHFSHRGRWMSARYLPFAYRNYDLYGLYKVVIADNDPWRFNNRHMNDYRRFRGNRNQVVIRSSNDNRYRDSRRNEVRWYDDNRTNRSGGANDFNNGRNDRRDYNGRSVADRDTDRNGRQNNNNKEYNRSDNKRSERSNLATDKEYAEVRRSSEKSERSSGRSSASDRR